MGMGGTEVSADWMGCNDDTQFSALSRNCPPAPDQLVRRHPMWGGLLLGSPPTAQAVQAARGSDHCSGPPTTGPRKKRWTGRNRREQLEERRVQPPQITNLESVHLSRLPGCPASRHPTSILPPIPHQTVATSNSNQPDAFASFFFFFFDSCRHARFSSRLQMLLST